ncbi:MAG: hypothetical protein JWO45_718 [Spartobacteria bacterium]|nr:hypothetical protein [Spartobacteria bacterium]
MKKRGSLSKLAETKSFSHVLRDGVIVRILKIEDGAVHPGAHMDGFEHTTVTFKQQQSLIEFARDLGEFSGVGRHEPDADALVIAGQLHVAHAPNREERVLIVQRDTVRVFSLLRG